MNYDIAKWKQAQYYYKWTLEKEQSGMNYRETLITLGTQDEEKHNTMCVRHHYVYMQTNTNKTGVLLQTTGGKDEPNIT